MTFSKIAASIPETAGTVIDPSGLFGLERSSNGMVRAIGPDGKRSTFSAPVAVAEALVISWMPFSEDIASLLDDGDRDGALLEATSFVKVWDRMAPGEARVHLALELDGRLTDCECIGIKGFALPELGHDGYIYLSGRDGVRSLKGVVIHTAVEILLGWDGVSHCADLASEFCNSDDDISDAMLRRWDNDAISLPWIHTRENA